MVQVQLVRIPSETVAVVRREIPRETLPTFFDEAFGRVAGVLPEAGGEISGPRFGLVPRPAHHDGRRGGRLPRRR